MEYTKSYTLTPAQKAGVEATLAAYKEQTKSLAHIVCERVPTEQELHQCGYYDEDDT
jgi:hypothetical protein